jgi:thiosulfate/3-mercaptopyruvate sulfurtransferase
MKYINCARILIFLSLLCPLLLPSPATASSPAPDSSNSIPSTFASSEWVVDADTARELIESYKVTVLDSRGKTSWMKGHAPGALPVDWKDFSQTSVPSKGGLLKDDATLTKMLQKLGISAKRPVLVVGNPPRDWGEDGRIVWMLRALGHPKVALVNGGYGALKKAGLKMSSGSARSAGAAVKPGDFVAKYSGDFSIERDELRALLGSPNLVIVDTRERREFDGKTPYGESRGGHVPGAKHLYFEELMRPDGRLLPHDELVAKLKSLGITADKKIVSYCTGGVRAGWLTAVLKDLGYDEAMNYAGSMWEWSAADADTHPLIK